MSKFLQNFPKKLFFVPLVSFLLLAVSASTAFAQQGSFQPTIVTELTPTVRITFTKLAAGGQYRIFWNEKVLAGETDADQTTGINHRFTADESESYSVDVCGHLQDSGGLFRPNLHTLKTNCTPGQDWFNGGRTYKWELQTCCDNHQKLLPDFSFYTFRYYPEEFIVFPANPTNADEITVSAHFNHIKPGGDKRNDYKIKISGNLTAESDKIVFKTPGTQGHNFGTLPVGSYVAELVDEGSDFVLMSQIFTVGTRESPGSQGDLIQDPNSDDKIGPLKVEPGTNPNDLSRLPNLSIIPLPSVREPIQGEINTGLGIISTNPKDFVNTTLSIAIGIAGGLAFLLIVYGGFRMAFSQGDPKAVQEARDILTAAIVGLLLIILSVFILNLIGVSILGLPLNDS